VDIFEIGEGKNKKTSTMTFHQPSTGCHVICGGGAIKTGELRYRPFGVTRFASGTTPTSVRFTGQREEAALGLYFYNARWYDPALGHFLSPDSIVPEASNALDYHRYAYVRFNPLKYTDPSGHYSDQALMTHFGCETWACVEAHFQEGGSHAGLWGWLDVLLQAEDGDFVQAIISFNGQMSTVSGRFATVEGKITVQGPQLQFGKEAPFRYAEAWSELTFAQTARMGSWETGHNAFYMGRHGASVYDQRYPDCRHQDCVTQALDAAATASSAVAAGCAMAGAAPCALIAGSTSTFVGAVSTTRTAFISLTSQGSALDAAVSFGLFRAGMKASPNVGLAINLAQWTWDATTARWEKP
jgi:RHS repeat-associated protein